MTTEEEVDSEVIDYVFNNMQYDFSEIQEELKEAIQLTSDFKEKEMLDDEIKFLKEQYKIFKDVENNKEESPSVRRIAFLCSKPIKERLSNLISHKSTNTAGEVANIGECGEASFNSNLKSRRKERK